MAGPKKTWSLQRIHININGRALQTHHGREEALSEETAGFKIRRRKRRGRGG
jgi:hypothetical protein